jgi:hypothetical protein
VIPPYSLLSRRQLFIRGGAIFATAISLTHTQSVLAQSKTSKKVAKYQNHPNKGRQCSQCRYFRPPKSCQLVEGEISPDGWCSFFFKKS